MALEKEISKLKTENKYLLDKAVKNRKEINVIRPNSKELMSKEPTEENRLLGQGTMVGWLDRREAIWRVSDEPSRLRS